MNTINIAADATAQRIGIGNQYENLATAVVFDCSKFAEDHGAGTAQVIHRRPTESVGYVCTNVSQTNNTVTWLVTDDDTSFTGKGQVQLRWYVNDVLRESVIFPTYILPSVASSDDAPAEVKSALEQLMEWVNDNTISIEDLDERIADYFDDHPLPVDGLDTELKDIRVGADGVTYPSAGDAVRGQISDLKEDLTSLKKSEFDFLMGWHIGDMSNGTYKPLKYRVCSEKVALTKNICVRANSGYQIYTVRYSADGTVAQSVSFRSAIVCKAGTIVSITIKKSTESTSAEADVQTFAENVYNDRCDTGDYEIYDKGNASGNATNPTTRAITDLISGGIGRISIRSDGYDHYLEQYTLDGTQLTDTAWIKGSADYSLDLQKNYKVVFRNTGNTAIDLSDMANNVAVYRIATGMPDILNVNADIIPQIQQTFVGRPTLTGSTDSVLSFVWFSDIHKAQKQWDRAVQLGNYYSTKFSFGIHTGDYVGSDQSSYEALYQNGVKSVIPLLNVVGNHDIYTNFANRTWAEKSVTKGIVMPDTTDWGVNWGGGDYPMNYYKDFSSQKIRLVVLDDYYDTEAQTTWLATVLDGANALGYHVITAAHETSRPITAWSDNTFCSQDAAALTANGGLNHSSTPYDAVIKAFKDGGGVHIAHLCGHEHVDLMGKSSNGVLNIVIGSQHGYYADASDAMRISDTVTDDLINVVGINANLGIIKIVRVGVNTDHYLRGRNVLCYDYINDTTIDNH